jgi:hypothetical protein
MENRQRGIPAAHCMAELQASRYCSLALGARDRRGFQGAISGVSSRRFVVSHFLRQSSQVLVDANLGINAVQGANGAQSCPLITPTIGHATANQIFLNLFKTAQRLAPSSSGRRALSNVSASTGASSKDE